MYADQNNPGLQQFQRMRAVGRRKVEVLQNNPNLTEKQALQIAQRQLQLQAKRVERQRSRR